MMVYVNNKIKLKITRYCIIEVPGDNYFRPIYLHFTPQVQFEVSGMKKKNSRQELSILQL